MTRFIDTILEPALWFAVDWSLRWAALLTVVALVLWIFRPRRAAIRESVLKAALLAGLLIPFFPRWGDGWEWHQLSTPSPPPSFPRSAWERTSGRSASRLTQERDATQSVAPERYHALRGNEGDLPSGEHQPSDTRELLETRRLLVLCLTSCWGLMVAYQLLRYLGGWFYLRRLRRDSVEATGPTMDLFAACRAELHAGNSVRLAVHSQTRSPILVCWLRPRIIVPPDWPQRSIDEVGSRRGGQLTPFPKAPSRTGQAPFSASGSPVNHGFFSFATAASRSHELLGFPVFHLPPFAMWPAFPASDYYGGSVPIGVAPRRESRVPY